MGRELGFTGGEIGSVYATMGIASLFMPALLGIVADRWVNAERLLGICHLLGAACLVWISTITSPSLMFVAMLINVMVYMPTIALANTVSYNALEKAGMDIVKDYPPIRTWGTVGFVLSMWIVDIAGFAFSKHQLYFGAAMALVLGFYAFTLPACPPAKTPRNGSLVSALGLDAFKLFRIPKMAIFFVFAMLLGAALQITNAFGSSFLDSFHCIPEYADSLAVRFPIILLSVSQISETFCILLIPFFLKRFGIKNVMLMSMLAWFLRFGLFGVGTPSGMGFVALLLSMIVYGVAFDFFNISGSLFVESEVKSNIRASAQGLFMIMTNGLGATIGGYGSGWVVEHFTANGVRDWPAIWFVFAGYALVIAIVFAIVFKYKHNPEAIAKKV